MKRPVLRILYWGAALSMVALMILCARSIAAIPAGAWGLSFGDEGAAPAGSDIAAVLDGYISIGLIRSPVMTK